MLRTRNGKLLVSNTGSVKCDCFCDSVWACVPIPIPDVPSGELPPEIDPAADTESCVEMERATAVAEGYEHSDTEDECMANCNRVWVCEVAVDETESCVEMARADAVAADLTFAETEEICGETCNTVFVCSRDSETGIDTCSEISRAELATRIDAGEVLVAHDTMEECNADCDDGVGPVKCEQTRNSDTGFNVRECVTVTDNSGAYDTIEECEQDACDYPRLNCEQTQHPNAPPTRDCGPSTLNPRHNTDEFATAAACESELFGHDIPCCCCQTLKLVDLHITNVRGNKPLTGNSLVDRIDTNGSINSQTVFIHEVDNPGVRLDIKATVPGTCFGHREAIDVRIDVDSVGGTFDFNSVSVPSLSATYRLIDNPGAVGDTDVFDPQPTPAAQTFVEVSPFLQPGVDHYDVTIPVTFDLSQRCFQDGGIDHEGVPLPPFTGDGSYVSAYRFTVFISVRDRFNQVILSGFLHGNFECCDCSSPAPPAAAGAGSAFESMASGLLG